MYFIKKPKIFRKNILVVGEPIFFEKYYDQKPTKEILDQASEELTLAYKNLISYN